MTRDDWKTPVKLFQYLNGFCHFTIDAAASKSNALCPRFWDEETDALKQDWSKEVVFCNPPYSMCKEFCDKARREATRCLLLLPVRSDRIWYQKIINAEGWSNWPVTGRLHFDDSNKGAFMYSILLSKGLPFLFATKWVDAARFNANGKGGAKS